MFNLKEIIRLQEKNEALKIKELSLKAEKQKLELQKEKAIEMINDYDYFNDNVFTLLNDIKKVLNS